MDIIAEYFSSQILCSYPVTPSKLIVPQDLGSLRQLYTAILLRRSEKLEPKTIETDKSVTNDVPDRSNDEKSSDINVSSAGQNDEQNSSGYSKDDVKQEKKFESISEQGEIAEQISKVNVTDLDELD